MRTFIKLNLFLLLCGISNFIFGQQKSSPPVKHTTQGSMFTKECRAISGGMQECVLCKDKDLRDCNRYICYDGNCEQIYIKKTVLENIHTSVGIDGIKNVKLDEIAPGIKVHYIDDGNYRAYIINGDKNYHVIVYEKPVNNKPASEGTSKKEECYNFCREGVLNCEKECGDSEWCFDQCIVSGLACSANCRKFAQKSAFDVPVLNNSKTKTTKK